MYFSELWTMYDTYLSSYNKKIHTTLTRTLHGGYARFFFPWQLFRRLGVVSSASPWKHGCQGPVISFQPWSMELYSITGLWTRDNIKTLLHYEMYEGMVKKLISCIVYFGFIDSLNILQLISIFVLQKAVCSMPGWCAFSSWWLLVVGNAEGFGGDEVRKS